MTRALAWRRWILLLALSLAGAVLIAGWRNSRAAPVVRTARIGLADWPAAAPPVRAVLLADLHLGNLSTDRARLDHVVREVAALRPDLVLIAGDMVEGYDPQVAAREAAGVGAALARLRPPLGLVAVLGNHDNWSDPAAIARALRTAGVTVVENGAVRRGPLLIGGSGDTVSGHARLRRTLIALDRLAATRPGARVFVSHAPDIERWLPRVPTLLLAGHTHCGQVVLPLIGPIVRVSRLNGNRLRCGIVRSGPTLVVVTAGIGTSNLPVRFGAPPDLWLLTLGPAQRASRAATPSTQGKNTAAVTIKSRVRTGSR